MTVSSQTPITLAVGTGAATTFPASFRCDSEDDAVAIIDGVEQSAAAFSVTGLGGATCSFVFTTAPANGAKVALLRRSVLQRLTDYATLGDFRSEVVNPDFDRLWLALQEFQTGAQTAVNVLRAPTGESISALSDAASRADKILAFDSSGNPVATAPVDGTATALATELASTAGASDIGTEAGITVQDYINANERSVLELVPKSQWSAILDGTSVYDATAALQAMLAAGGSWFIPGGLWNSDPIFASATKPTTLRLGAGCIIKARAGFTDNQHLISTATGGELTIFAGAGAKLVMRKADYSALGDFIHCLFIWECAKTHVYGLTCEDPGGDCFYIGGDSGQPANDVILHGCTGRNGRRNSLSIVNIRKLRVEDSTLEEASGYAFGPCAGIDIESNLLPGYYLEDVVIDRCLTRNNVGAGILITPQSKANPVSITVRDCVSINDGGSLTQGKGALSLTAAMAYRTVAPLTDPSNIGKIPGFVRVINQSIINPPLSGFVSTNWTENAPLTTVEGLYILNPYSSLDPGAADRQKVGVLIRGQTGSEGLYGSSIGNMTICGLDIRDDRAVKAMHIPIYLEPADEASKPIKDLHFEDVEVVDGEWTLATGSVPVLRAGSLAVTNYSMSYRRERKLVSSSSFTVGLTHAGMTLVASAGTSFSLPDADGKIGMEIEVELDAASTLQLPLLDATDTMRPISTVSGKGILTSARSSRARLKAEAGRWRIVSTVGTWTAIP